MKESSGNKKKIINDPVHGFITITNNILHDIIEHPYFQRLRRIKQLGLTHLVYPGAMHTRFQPMFDAGASTVWEMFPGSDFDANGFPTRSHCHAWSSSPIYFLNRIVLGIRQTAVGGAAFEISPWLGNLRRARGGTATPKGVVSVDWKIKGKVLSVAIKAPNGVKTEFKPNASHNGLSVEVVQL